MSAVRIRAPDASHCEPVVSATGISGESRGIGSGPRAPLARAGGTGGHSGRPAKPHPGEGLRLLKSCEVDILEDGSLDLSDDILKELDLVICSIHY